MKTVTDLLNEKQHIQFCIHYQKAAHYYATAAQSALREGRPFTAKIQQEQAKYHARQAWIRLARILNADTSPWTDMRHQ